MHKSTKSISIRKGIRQGDLSKALKVTLKNLIRSLNGGNKGRNTDEELLNHLRLVENAKDLEGMFQQLADERKRYGLKMSITKTKVKFVPKEKINVNNSEIEAVEQYIYPGQKLNLVDKTQKRGIHRMINASWAACAEHKEIFKSQIVQIV